MYLKYLLLVTTSTQDPTIAVFIFWQLKAYIMACIIKTDSSEISPRDIIDGLSHAWTMYGRLKS